MSIFQTVPRLTDFVDSGPVWPTSKGCSGINVYSWTKESQEWHQSRIYHEASSTNSGETCLTISESADVAIFVVPHENVLNHCITCKESLHEAFAFLQMWWEESYLNANGNFGYQDDFDDSGQSLGVYSWSRFALQLFSAVKDGEEVEVHHKWKDIIPFTYWHKKSNKLRMLLLRTEENVVQCLLTRILDTLQKGLISNPLWPYASIFEEIIRCQHDATFAVRDMVMFEESRRITMKQPRAQADYPRLHLVAKHATTVAEILEINLKTLECIVECHKLFADSPAYDLTMGTARQLLHTRFLFQQQVLFGIFSRCTSYKERIRNEIQQTFNIVAQEDAKVSAVIAAAARADSQTMTTIGIITVIFLPPTFISAVFSTSFFDFGENSQSWSVSDKFYIYWASVLPTTIFVAAIFHRRFLRRTVSAIGSTPHQLARRMTTSLDVVKMQSNTGSEPIQSLA